MMSLLKKLWDDESGQALVEYALVVGLAAAAVIASVVIFRGQLLTLWQGLTTSLSTAVAATGGAAQ